MFFTYLWLLCLCGTLTISTADNKPIQACPEEEDRNIRMFNSLDDYKALDVDFNPLSYNYRGNFIAFKEKYFRHLPQGAFIQDSSHYLMELNLSNKALRDIEDGAFNSLTCLRYLDLSQNELVILRRNQFLDLLNLIVLNISWNNLYRINHFTFKFLPTLNMLDLSYNHILELEDFAFHQLVHLESLSLKRNRMRTFGKYIFNHLTSLKDLDMSFNAIGVIDFTQLSAMDSLETLDLSGNGAAIFSFQGIKEYFYHVQFLNLSMNNLVRHFDARHLRKYFPSEELVVDINDNNFFCHDLDTFLRDLKRYKLKYAPGRSFDVPQHREHISCDTLNASHGIDFSDYSNILDILSTTTTVQPTPFDLEGIIDLYDRDSAQYRQMLVTLICINCVVFIYNVLIIVDYMFNFGYIRRLCIRRQEAAADIADEPTEYVPLDS